MKQMLILYFIAGKLKAQKKLNPERSMSESMSELDLEKNFWYSVLLEQLTPQSHLSTSYACYNSFKSIYYSWVWKPLR